LREIVNFIDYVNNSEYEFTEEEYLFDNYFNEQIEKITMNSLKEYYLHLLLHIDHLKWKYIYNHMTQTRKLKFSTEKNDNSLSKTKSMEQIGDPKYTVFGNKGGEPIRKSNSVSVLSEKIVKKSSGVSITTEDAYTLTDGPTIFLVEDVKKIANFYIQQSNIPATIFQNILSKITNNGKLIERIEILESMITAKETKVENSLEESKNNSKNEIKEKSKLSNESERYVNEIEKLRNEIRSVSLDAKYLPNTKQHQQIWTPTKEVFDNAFVSNIGEEVSREIMLLNIENYLKVLLLLGIGIFIENANPKYMEIMKKLADEQRLFIIIASSDYIYGTNYQFCHGFIGKDLTHMTQQKTLQAMGRIGRNNIQQDYTIRFRDDDMIMQLFREPDINMEAKNMCLLFSQ
jgi:hypothetical protein